MPNSTRKKASDSPRGRPRGDHESKREEVAEATWRLLRREGIEGTSMRSIARELGCTTGVLLHYFSDKEDLLGYAMALSFAKLRERLAAATASFAHEPLVALRSMALTALPMEEESRVQWHVWLVFLSRAHNNGDFAQLARERAEEILRIVEELLESARNDGAIRLTIEVEPTAQRLLAAIDGLALRMRFDPDRYSNERVESIVDSMLSELATGTA